MRTSLLTTAVCSLAVAGLLSLTPALGAELPGPRSAQTAPAPAGRDLPKPAPSATGRIGLALQDLTPDLAEALGLPEGFEGLLVRSVQEGGPAFRVGMKPGMVIVTIDGKRAKAPKDLAAAVGRKPAGTPITLGVMAGPDDDPAKPRLTLDVQRTAETPPEATRGKPLSLYLTAPRPAVAASKWGTPLPGSGAPPSSPPSKPGERDVQSGP